MLNYLPLRWWEDLNGNKVLKTNLCRRIALPQLLKEDSRAFLRYTVRDSEDPRDIAQRYYDNSEDFWLIMLVNDVHDLRTDWPKSNNQLTEDAIAEYGREALGSVLHYEDAKGIKIDLNGLRVVHNLYSSNDSELVARFSLRPVTLIEHLKKQNDVKRFIKVLRKDVAVEVKNAVRELF